MFTVAPKYCKMIGSPNGRNVRFWRFGLDTGAATEARVTVAPIPIARELAENEVELTLVAAVLRVLMDIFSLLHKRNSSLTALKESENELATWMTIFSTFWAEYNEILTVFLTGIPCFFLALPVGARKV